MNKHQQKRRITSLKRQIKRRKMAGIVRITNKSGRTLYPSMWRRIFNAIKGA
jgi:hypothetical protein